MIPGFPGCKVREYGKQCDYSLPQAWLVTGYPKLVYSQLGDSRRHQELFAFCAAIRAFAINRFTTIVRGLR